MGCHVDTWSDQKEYIIHEGNQGEWQGSMTMCSDGKAISAFAAKSVIQENHPDGEAMGINGFKFFCVYKDWSGNSKKTLEYDNMGSWKGFYEGYTL